MQNQVTWDFILKAAPPGQTLAQHSPLSPIKAISTFRLSKKIDPATIDFFKLREEATKAFDRLGCPYDSSSLAVGPLTRVVEEELRGWWTFGLPGPMTLNLPNRCCGEKVCAIRQFYGCIVKILKETLS